MKCEVCEGGICLEHVSEFKYLGCVSDELGTDEAVSEDLFASLLLNYFLFFLKQSLHPALGAESDSFFTPKKK